MVRWSAGRYAGGDGEQEGRDVERLMRDVAAPQHKVKWLGTSCRTRAVSDVLWREGELWSLEGKSDKRRHMKLEWLVTSC